MPYDYDIEKRTKNKDKKALNGGKYMNEVIVSMNNISKTFLGVKALDNVHFELRSGEVMALLGENGAGKSTLMKILSGVYTRDGGTMEIFGKSYDDLTPKQAQEAGVAIIHQELNMCKHLSVAENMFLGREMVAKGILDNRKMRQEARNILNELKIDIDPDQTVGDLPVSKQQMVEIAKALSIHAKILIMDEPTSALTAREIEDFFRIIKDLKAQGCGIVYISHRLEELAETLEKLKSKIGQKRESERDKEVLIQRAQKNENHMRSEFVLALFGGDFAKNQNTLTEEVVEDTYHIYLKPGFIQAFCLKMDCEENALGNSSVEVLKDKAKEILERNLKDKCLELAMEIRGFYGLGFVNYEGRYQDEIRRVLKNALNQIEIQKAIFK